MTPNEEYKFRQSIIDDVNSHSIPSRETLERFNLMEITQTRMEGKIDNIENKVDGLITLVEKIENAKADKWVESFSKGLMVLMATSFVSLLAYLGVKIFESIYK